MKRLLVLSIVFFCLGGCESPMSGPQSLFFRDKNIYQGQSNDSVTEALGDPDMVSSGFYTKNSWAGGPFFATGERTVEWVFLNVDESLIVWLDNGIVARICIVPTSKIRR